ncbi:hypothetical protein ABZW11_00580 [Nonomuraea sp. NPDC004580]|uniref:hypothetical protein n=1 Tax=Nonomuraea sp. NPDC004580 TaxID=3154552 RepID=UPI0033B36C52
MTEFERFLDRALADREVLGLVLSGSHAREGTATSHSDHDVYAVGTWSGSCGGIRWARRCGRPTRSCPCWPPP